MSKKIFAGIETVLLAVGLALLTGGEALAGRAGLDAGKWWAEVEDVDAKLRAGKWKAGKRAAGKLAEDVLLSSWHDRELRRVLAELAFHQAAASANLGEKDDAVWFWHMAQNVDPKIRDKDFAPYGEAGKLLREFPLRRKGQVPPTFRVVRSVYGRRFTRPVVPKDWSPTIPRNPGVANERSGDVHVELIVDRHGQPHHPVILTPDNHPVLVYGMLESLRTMPRFEPARDSGEPVDSLFKYVISPRTGRWDQGGQTFTGRVN